jgi:hypothetical protein
MAVSQAIGIDMPNDFCTAAHNAIVKKLGPFRPQNPAIWSELAAGWNAVAIRFKSLANADERYTVSIKSEEASSSHHELLTQQEALFAFFMNGYAALESFAYAMFAMGAMVCPDDFPMKTPGHRQAINPATTKMRFTEKFGGTIIEARLAALIGDPQFKRWGGIRNVLAHRCEPPRHHHLSIGGSTPRRTDWEIVDGLAIDDQTTASSRPWLATTLAGCVTAAEAFATANFA